MYGGGAGGPKRMAAGDQRLDAERLREHEGRELERAPSSVSLATKPPVCDRLERALQRQISESVLPAM